MNKKRPIDRQREAAITLTVGADDDKSAIQEFLSTSHALFIIKGSGVYKIQFADDIDPERTNPSIPNLSQRVLLAGYDNEVVARILLTAKGLFDENNATVKPFVGSLFERSFDLTKHVLELHEMISELREKITQKEKSFLEKEQKPNAFCLPSIPDLNKSLHNIFVKSDKAKDSILALYRLHFLPDAKKKPLLAEYDSAIESLLSAAPDLVTAWSETKNTFNLIRNMRNASEHPREGQKIILADFTMNPDGTINPPLVEIQHKDTPIGLLPLVELLDFIQDLILAYAESSLVFIRCAMLLDKNPFGESVAEFSSDERRHPLVRYYRAINMGGKVRILG